MDDKLYILIEQYGDTGRFEYATYYKTREEAEAAMKKCEESDKRFREMNKKIKNIAWDYSIIEANAGYED